MSPRRTVGTLMVLAVSLLGLGAVPGSLPAAQARAGSPPVTTPDAATVYQGNGATVQPVDNDHDADNELLTICRIGTEHYKGLSADFFQNDWEVFANPNAKPGVYTFTYYACDFATLVPGTITITVKELPDVTVSKIASRPGHLRVTNPADFKVRFLYGSFKEDKPDGRILIGKGASVVISVFRARIDWIATDRKGELFVGSGHVDHIKLGHAAGRSPGNVSLSPRLSDAWRAAS